MKNKTLTLERQIEKKLVGADLILVKKSEFKAEQKLHFYLAPKKGLNDIKELRTFRDTIEDTIGLGRADEFKINIIQKLLAVASLAFYSKGKRVEIDIYPSVEIAKLCLEPYDGKMRKSDVEQILATFRLN